MKEFIYLLKLIITSVFKDKEYILLDCIARTNIASANASSSKSWKHTILLIKNYRGGDHIIFCWDSNPLNGFLYFAIDKDN